MGTFDPLDIRSQEQAQAQADDRSRLALQIEIDDLKWLMSNKRGRRFVARLLERAGVWRLSFNTNALAMAFSEGQRNEGLRLLAQVTAHCPDRYTELLKESTNDN
jgi:hypothetical protein